MRLGKETGSVSNYLMSGTNGQPKPEVGMGATILMWTDRRAATIIAVSRFKSGTRAGQVSEVTVQEDTATRTDDNGMSEMQTYEYTRNLAGATMRFKRNKAGAFVGNSGRLRIGDRRQYHDYSF
jgi:hypothetical protein